MKIDPHSLPPITAHQPFSGQPPPPVSDNGFPMLAVAVLGITATAFLLVSYYIFVTKSCFRWHLSDPLRRFSGLTRTQLNDDPPASYSPATWQTLTRGLDEVLIRQIPTFQYSKSDQGVSKCVVCLNEFQESDVLRLLPKCSHAFHLDCIDVWLQSCPNCPLCRSAISGRDRDRSPPEIVAPNSSPQLTSPNQEFVEILIRGEDGAIFSDNGRSGRSDSTRFSTRSTRKFELNKIKSKISRKSHHTSIMGDEGINLGEKDEQFSVQPIRRSFSMDSAADRCVYETVQEIMRRNREAQSNEEGGSRRRSSILSFGQGRSSRSAVLPL